MCMYSIVYLIESDEMTGYSFENSQMFHKFPFYSELQVNLRFVIHLEIQLKISMQS